jgi:integrase
MTRFTDRFIEALKPKTARYEVWESRGFGMRVSPRGVKSWVLVYHHAGRSRRLTLGAYPKMSLAEAHVRLAEARKQLGQGEDPGKGKVEENKAERSAETVSDLVEAYLERWARPRKRSANEDERQLRKDVLPRWGRRKAKDIRRRDVTALLDAIVNRGAPIGANRTLAAIRKMFKWALSQDLVEVNPCAGVMAPAKERRRDRVLNSDEIAALWRALGNPKLSMSPAIRLALKLQLVTAQRKGREVIAAEWIEFDLGERVWTIPGEKTKNGLPHRVPLAPLAMQILAEIATVVGRNSRWLFPSPKRIGSSITPGAVAEAMLDNREMLGSGDTTPHDLRRTAASHMTSIGISRLVVSKILNHAEPGVTAVYDRHSYDGEKRAALAAWGARLEEIIGVRAEGSNIARLAG